VSSKTVSTLFFCWFFSFLKSYSQKFGNRQDGAKPHQAKMVMKWLDKIFQDIYCLNAWWGTPQPWDLPSASCFWWTLEILPNSTPNFPLQSSHVSRETLVHFLFHVPPKKEIPWVALRWVGGRGVPPQALDDKHPVLVSRHSITVSLWCGLAPASCHTVVPYLAIPIPQGLYYGRKDIVLLQLHVAELVDPLICWQN
jgi:hypothetical protein